VSYRDFTIHDLKQKLGLRLKEDDSLYATVEEVVPSAVLVEQLRVNVPLALGINTEKARSELIIAPVLVEVLRAFEMGIGLFSGREFNVDASRGLVGVCDFLLSLSPERYVVTAPIFVVAEAKNLDMSLGIPQALAEMVAVQQFNRQSDVELDALHGVVTTGSAWRFLRIVGTTAWIDAEEYYIHDIKRILGILCGVVWQARKGAPAVS
jgi:hypothetical protein